MTDKENQRYGGDPHHPDHPRNRSNDADYRNLANEFDNKPIMNDPHHPDHPRNKVQESSVEEEVSEEVQAMKEAEEAASDVVSDETGKAQDERPTNDPHHPDHPRNRVE